MINDDSSAGCGVELPEWDSNTGKEGGTGGEKCLKQAHGGTKFG